MSAQESINQQVKLPILGAVIGFIPSIFLAVFQYRAQEHQLLMDRGMSAIRDFSSALNSTDVLQNLDDADAAMYGWSLAPRTLARETRALDAQSKAISSYRHYVANVRTASIVVDAVLHTKLPLWENKYIPHPMDTDTDVPTSNAEIKQLCKEAMETNEELRAELAKYDSQYQDALENIAAKMQ